LVVALAGNYTNVLHRPRVELALRERKVESAPRSAHLPALWRGEGTGCGWCLKGDLINS
jgi:hypothetical protein